MKPRARYVYRHPPGAALIDSCRFHTTCIHIHIGAETKRNIEFQMHGSTIMIHATRTRTEEYIFRGRPIG